MKAILWQERLTDHWPLGKASSTYRRERSTERRRGPRQLFACGEAHPAKCRIWEKATRTCQELHLSEEAGDRAAGLE